MDLCYIGISSRYCPVIRESWPVCEQAADSLQTNEATEGSTNANLVAIALDQEVRGIDTLTIVITQGTSH